MSSSIQLPLDNETAVVPHHPKHDAFDISNQNHVHPPNEGVVTMTIQEYERLLLLSRTATTSSSAGTSTTASTTTKDDNHTGLTRMRPPVQAPSLPQLIDDKTHVSDDDAARESNEQEQAAPPPAAAAAAAVDSGRPNNKKPSSSRWTRVVRWCSSRAKKRANRRRDRRRQQEPPSTPDNDPPRGDKQDPSEKVEAALNEAIVDGSLPMSKTETEEEEEKEELVVRTTHTSNSDVEALVPRRMNDQVELDGAKLDKMEHDLVVDGESSSLVHQSKSADNNDDKEDQTVCTSLFCDSADNVLHNENGSLDDREVDKQAVEQVSCQPSVDGLPQNRERELNDDLLDEEELAAVSPAKIEDYLGDVVQTEDGANGNEDNKQKVLVSTSSQHTVDEHELQTRENKHDHTEDENSAREQDDMHVVQTEGYKRDHNNDEVGLVSTARRQGHSMDDGAQKEELMLDGQDDTELAEVSLAREHLVDDTLQDQDGKHSREEDEQEQAVVLAFRQHGTEDVRQTQERKHDHDKLEHIEVQAEESNHHDKDEQAVGPVAQMHDADDDEEGNEGDDQYPVLPARRHSMGNLLEARECKQDHEEDGKAAIPASGHHSVGDLMQRKEHEAVETPTRRSVSELLRNYERKSIVAPRARFKYKEPETPQPTSKSDVRNNLQSGVVRPRAGRIGSQKFNLS